MNLTTSGASTRSPPRAQNVERLRPGKTGGIRVRPRLNGRACRMPQCHWAALMVDGRAPRDHLVDAAVTFVLCRQETNVFLQLVGKGRQDRMIVGRTPFVYFQLGDVCLRDSCFTALTNRRLLFMTGKPLPPSGSSPSTVQAFTTCRQKPTSRTPKEVCQVAGVFGDHTGGNCEKS